MSAASHAAAHRVPRNCPVCAARLSTTRLGCTSCGTELSGLFAPCRFCGLAEDDLELLRVFLVSRGNMKELERFLGVSYPTARARYAELLVRLELEPDPQSAPASREEVLRRLAAGDLDVAGAAALLGSTPGTARE